MEWHAFYLEEGRREIKTLSFILMWDFHIKCALKPSVENMTERRKILFLFQSLYFFYIYHKHPLFSIQREYSQVIMDFTTPEAEVAISREFMSLSFISKQINP